VAQSLREKLRLNGHAVSSLADTRAALERDDQAAADKAVNALRTAKEQLYKGALADAVRTSRAAIAAIEEDSVVYAKRVAMQKRALVFLAFACKQLKLEEEAQQAIAALAKLDREFLPDPTDYPPSFQSYFLRVKKLALTEIPLSPASPQSNGECVIASNAATAFEKLSRRLGRTLLVVDGEKPSVVRVAGPLSPYREQDVETLLAVKGPLPIPFDWRAHQQEQLRMASYLTYATTLIALGATGVFALEYQSASRVPFEFASEDSRRAFRSNRQSTGVAFAFAGSSAAVLAASSIALHLIANDPPRMHLNVGATGERVGLSFTFVR
jgi:hypothetical protein